MRNINFKLSPNRIVESLNFTKHRHILKHKNKKYNQLEQFTVVIKQLFNEIYVCKDHSSAAVSFKTKLIKSVSKY